MTPITTARLAKGAGLALGLLALAPAAPAAAQDAKAILAKSTAAFKGMKTYQADWVMEANSPQGPLSMLIQIKRAGNKAAMNMKAMRMPKGTPLQPGATLMNAVVDGKYAYAYIGMLNQYQKTPVDAATQKSLSMTPDSLMRMDANGTLTRLPDTTIDGKPVLVVAYSGKPLASASGRSAVDKATFYIDKATHRFRRIKGNALRMGGPMAGQGQEATITVRNEKVNAPIPASAFVFTPPKGATQMQMNPGMMGGAGRK